MSVETGFLDVGFLVSDNDMRNSTITGTTLGGPNGSGQFCAVRVSTTNTFAIAISSAPSTGGFLGILQNKPSTGIAADVKIHGVSKVVLGSTGGGAVTVGSKLGISSLASGSTGDIGRVTLYSSTAGTPIGVSLENPTSVGQVFSAVIYGPSAATGGLIQ